MFHTPDVPRQESEFHMATFTPPTAPQVSEASAAPKSALPRTAPLVMPRERHIGLRLTLAALAAFLAITAIGGALFAVPTIPKEYLLWGPFTDFTIPALALGILVGGSALLAAMLVLLRPAAGAVIAILSGAMIIVFELVEIAVVGLSIVDQITQPVAWLQEFYLALGGVIIALGVTLWSRTQRRVLRPAFLPNR